MQYDSGKALRFAIRNLELKNLEKDHAVNYVLDMENPLPAGHISATGTFGPLNVQNVGATQVSGKFTFNEVKLSDVGDIHGTLASTGRFSGPLSAIQASGVSDTPDFAVDHGQPTFVRGNIQCTVNGTNGDVIFNSVEATSGRTTIHAQGQVAGSPKITTLDLAMDYGHAEDVLRPFMHQNVPVTGAASLHSHAWVGPTGKPFLERLRLDGRFDLPAAAVTNPEIEHGLSAFSTRERNSNAKPAADPPRDPSSGQASGRDDVLSSLAGPITIRNGIIATPGLLFQVPGARVQLHGTFDLNGENVHLLGLLLMNSSISHATTGWKSVLLKPFSTFFKREQHPGSKIPIAVVGTPGHYRVTQDISHTR